MIAIEAVFSRATTTLDGGWKITFDTDDKQEIEKLVQMKNKRLFVCVMTEDEQKQSVKITGK